MNKYIKILLGLLVFCACTASVVSCDDEGNAEYPVTPTHNGGNGK